MESGSSRRLHLQPPTRWDRIILWLNLVPILLSAAWRAVFYLLEINMSGWFWFCRPEFVQWGARDLGGTQAGSAGGKKRGREETLGRVRRALQERRAARIPHAGCSFPCRHDDGLHSVLQTRHQAAPAPVFAPKGAESVGMLLHKMRSTAFCAYVPS